MSIRIALLMLVILGLAIYAWRDWFIALCGVILLTAVMEHPDMPRTVMGIQGLNPRNVLILLVLIPWFVKRQAEGARWDMPWIAATVLALFLAIFIIALGRTYVELNHLVVVPEISRVTFGYLTTEYLINPMKTVLTGFLLYDGCRTRQRLWWGGLTVLALAVAYTFVFIRIIPLEGLIRPSLVMRYRHIVGEMTGLHPNDMALVISPALWAMVSLLAVWKSRNKRLMVLGLCVFLLAGIVATQSRAGYIATAGVGMLFGLARWRKLLVLLPASALLACIAFPTIPERMGIGFGVGSYEGQETNDWAEITAGRTTGIWPPVVDSIGESPIYGRGRLGMLRPDVNDRVLLNYDRNPGHPHNAYLEVLLDTGALGFVIVLTFYVALLNIGVRMLRDRKDYLVVFIGAMGTSNVAALLVMGLSGQSFFPESNVVTVWCAAGLALRMWVMRRQVESAARVYVPMAYGQAQSRRAARPFAAS